MHKILLLIFRLSVGVLAISCTKAEAPTKTLKIAVIPKGTTHEFWKSIHAGSNKAAQELAAQGTQIEVIWKGPLREDDREQQIQVVEGLPRRVSTASCLRRSTTGLWFVPWPTRNAQACRQ